MIRERSKLRGGLLILIFGVIIVGCPGKLIKHSWTTGDKVAFGAVVACIGADAGITKYGLDNGLRETNALFGDDPSTSTLLITSVIATSIIYWVAQYLTSDERKILYVPAGFNCFAAANNYKEIQEN